MAFCGDNCKKALAFGIAILFIIFGLLLVIGWDSAIHTITHNELTIQKGSQGFDNWVVTPIPMFLTFHLYNWTNADEVVKDWRIKPIVQEVGPYVFSEKHYRVNLQWNDNDTITYQTKRVWHFIPEMSNGTLADRVTTVNVIAATVANMVKNRYIFIRQAVNFFLEEKERSMILTKNVSEWLFDGYEDELLTLAKDLKLNLDMDKFGWFYNRNNSETYDGNVTMYTGKNDLELLGLFEEWNGRPYTSAYSSYCGFVNGTSGELWPPVEKYNKVSLFASDLCSSITVFHSNKTRFYRGIEGKEFIGTDFLFDNGTKYPEQECFRGDKIHPSGVRDVSKCKQGAPAFISYPHFYLGDESYRKGVVGMRPNEAKHKFEINLEPKTGVPLSVNARLQLNILIAPIPGITMFKNVKETMLPVLWFEQSADLSDELAGTVKTLLILPAIGQFTGIGLLAVGTLIACIAIYISFKSAWRDNEQTQLLPDRM